MALPVAQLGYMPNLSTPSGGGRYVVEDPWKQLAVQVLGQLASGAVGNLVQRDFTTQAQNEGLPVDPTAESAPWWKRMVSGPVTSRSDMERLRGNQTSTNIANTQEAGAQRRTKMTEEGADRRSAAQIAATEREGAATRTHAVNLHQLDAGSRERIALADNATRQAIAEGQNFTQLAGLDKQNAGALERTGLTNQNNIDVANIRESDRAQLMRMIQDMIGRNAQLRAVGIQMPDDSVMIEALIQHANKLGFGTNNPAALPR